MTPELETCYISQEAVYFLLGMPVVISSRSEIFIQTGRPDDRVFMLKNKRDLKSLPLQSQNITVPSVLTHYINRPDVLNGMCLASFAAYYDYSSGWKLKAVGHAETRWRIWQAILLSHTFTLDENKNTLGERVAHKCDRTDRGALAFQFNMELNYGWIKQGIYSPTTA